MDLKNIFVFRLILITKFLPKARSKNGYGFQRSSLKTGVENYIFWSEIGSGFEEPGGTPLTKNSQEYPSPPGPHVRESSFWKPGNFCVCNPESGKVLLIDSGTLGFWNKAQGIRNPSSTDKESTSSTWNPESKTVLDSLIQGDPKGTIKYLSLCSKKQPQSLIKAGFNQTSYTGTETASTQDI